MAVRKLSLMAQLGALDGGVQGRGRWPVISQPLRMGHALRETLMASLPLHSTLQFSIRGCTFSAPLMEMAAE